MDTAAALKLLKFLTPVYDATALQRVKMNLVYEGFTGTELMKRLLKEQSVELATPEARFHQMINLQKELLAALRNNAYGADDAAKGTFANCKSPVEVFFHRQRIEREIVEIQHRFGFAVNENGHALLRDCREMRTVESLRNLNLKHREKGKLLFLSFRIARYHLNVDVWYRRGFEVKALGGQRMRPMVDVWSPTFQDYINMIDDYLKAEKLSGDGLDIGSGTGVLALVLAKHGLKVTALDSSPAAVECTRLNATLLRYSVKTVLADIQDELDLPEYDVMVCNPPWLPAPAVHLLLPGLFDEDEVMLKNCIRLAGKRLKPTGRLLLVYSDLAALIGLQPTDRIERLCEEHGLKVASVIKQKNDKANDPMDPLITFKKNSHFLLLDIRRT